MIGFVLRRLAQAIPTLFLVVTGSFFLIRLAPGGPFGPGASAAAGGDAESRPCLRPRPAPHRPVWPLPRRADPGRSRPLLLVPRPDRGRPVRAWPARLHDSRRPRPPSVPERGNRPRSLGGVPARRRDRPGHRPPGRADPGDPDFRRGAPAPDRVRPEPALVCRWEAGRVERPRIWCFPFSPSRCRRSAPSPG